MWRFIVGSGILGGLALAFYLTLALVYGFIATAILVAIVAVIAGLGILGIDLMLAGRAELENKQKQGEINKMLHETDMLVSLQEKVREFEKANPSNDIIVDYHAAKIKEQFNKEEENTPALPAKFITCIGKEGKG